MRLDPNAEPNYFDMSDDEVMGMSTPAAAAAAVVSDPVVTDPVVTDPVVVEPVDPTPTPVEVVPEPVVPATPAQPAASQGVDPALGAADDKIPSTPLAVDPAAKVDPKVDPVVDPAAKVEPTDPKVEPVKPVEPPKDPTPEDYKAFYDRIIGKPIRANGKDIQLRSPEEAERLIQMGLNYTKKMQGWQPRMRVVTMLENNGLMDEAKLAHLIDLSKGEAGAIQKLLADTKFDPMTVDADKAASYKPGNHQVSDKEVAFNAALDDLELSNTGVELITEMSKQWDEQSQQAVYHDPSILRVINEQKSLGLYARITGEMDHLKSLGHLQGVPFLQAYKAVGDMLNDQGRLNPEPQKQVAEVPVETRVATPAPKVTNNEKAAAASPTKATPVAAKTETNFLDLPDDTFLNTFQGRL